MGFIADFFLGKEVELEFDLKPTTAIIETDSQDYKVSRDGYISYFINGPYVNTGLQIVKSYLKQCNSFIESDDGKLIPVHKVKCIKLEVQSQIVKEKYRK